MSDWERVWTNITLVGIVLNSLALQAAARQAVRNQFRRRTNVHYLVGLERG